MVSTFKKTNLWVAAMINAVLQKKAETIDRIIEVSIMGVLNDGRFQRGLIDIPLVFSDAYILTDAEVRKIFEFSSDISTSVCIGSINDYKEEKLYISANACLPVT